MTDELDALAEVADWLAKQSTAVKDDFTRKFYDGHLPDAPVMRGLWGQGRAYRRAASYVSGVIKARRQRLMEKNNAG